MTNAVKNIMDDLWKHTNGAIVRKYQRQSEKRIPKRFPIMRITATLRKKQISSYTINYPEVREKFGTGTPTKPMYLISMVVSLAVRGRGYGKDGKYKYSGVWDMRPEIFREYTVIEPITAADVASLKAAVKYIEKNFFERIQEELIKRKKDEEEFRKRNDRRRELVNKHSNKTITKDEAKELLSIVICDTEKDLIRIAFEIEI